MWSSHPATAWWTTSEATCGAVTAPGQASIFGRLTRTQFRFVRDHVPTAVQSVPTAGGATTGSLHPYWLNV
jgi:hypothetical protein